MPVDPPPRRDSRERLGTLYREQGRAALSHWTVSCDALGMPFGQKPLGFDLRESSLKGPSGKSAKGSGGDRGVRSWQAYDHDTAGLGSATGTAIPIAPLHLSGSPTHHAVRLLGLPGV